MISYGRQHITPEDIESVVSVLRSDFLTQGQVVPRFEQAIADRVGAKFGIAANSATSSLHVACLALGVGKDDLVWTVPNTFVASANCALFCGAKIDFVDIDDKTYNMSVEALELKLIEAKKINKLPKVIIPVHFSGQSCHMQAIHALCQPLGIKIIEDASHAIGATYLQTNVGSCLYSDITVFSFHPVKIITTAEGGMAMTNDHALAEKMKLFRCHGITKDTNDFSIKSEGGWFFEQIELGYNYRMTDVLAALGLSQLSSLDQFLQKRREIAAKYDAGLSSLPVTLPFQDNHGLSSYHLYVIRCKENRKMIYDHMQNNGIGVNVHYIPVHLHPFFKKMGFREGQFPVSERYYKEALSLPIFPSLKTEDFQKVTSCLIQSFH